MSVKLPMAGGCGCGRVRYEIRAKPIAVYVCHCTDCQRQSGSAFGMSMAVPRDAVVVLSGTPRTWQRRADSGRLSLCYFCPDCGTRLYHHPTHSPHLAFTKPGTLDDASWLDPAAHIWVKSAQEWSKPPADALAFPAQAPDFSLIANAWVKLEHVFD